MNTASSAPSPDPLSQNQISPQKDIRGILAFPEIDSFYNTLMDRVQMAVGFFFQRPFTVFINALPRNHEEGVRIEVPRFGTFPLIYAGVTRQKSLMGEPRKPSTALDQAWGELNETRKYKIYEGDEVKYDSATMSTERAVISKELYQGFRNGGFELKDVKLGTLSGYFSSLEDKPALFQQEEYIILSAYYNIQQYHYLSVPLIQFAEFDGVVHIIYHEEDHGGITQKDGDIREWVIGNIIKSISREYEGIILDWDIVGGNAYRKSVVDRLVDGAIDPDFYANLSKNPILKDLGYRDYYERHKEYFADRIRMSDEIPLTIMEQFRRTAVLSILLDSYTHNISAHSLVALEGWYKQRALWHDKAVEHKPDTADLPFVRDDRYFDYETHEFIRFMLDKGAFWTGLTRDYSLGGKTNSFYTVLWRDFVNNPLYLGTIAFTEGILSLKVNITVLQAEGRSVEGVLWHKKVVVGGNFVTINLKKLNEAIKKAENGDYEYLSGFVAKGEAFEALKQELRAYKAFFPGGVVGKHAFFTILENEIRNVKHYSEAEIVQIAKEGLTLNISIEKCPYEEYKYGQDIQKEPEYYKVGVWLHHPVKMSGQMMADRIERLNQDIINEYHNPRLGGAYQDKICAALLFNNAFSSVEQVKTARDKRFYPWMKVGFSQPADMEAGTTVEDYELSARRYYGEDFKSSREAFEDRFVEAEGYYKKFFHIWRGENIHHYTGNKDMDPAWENLSRFRFVYTPNDNEAVFSDNFRHLREKGIIRIIDAPAENLGSAYSAWFHRWFKHANASIRVKIEEQTVAQLYWDGQTTQYRLCNASNLPLPSDHSTTLTLAHGNARGIRASSREIRYRSHGIFIQHFLSGKTPSEAILPEEGAAELMEALGTCICMFDRRIHKWFEQYNEEKMQALGCEAYDEQLRYWDAIANTPEGFFKYHFLVVHLSFIEKFPKEGGSYYTEDSIDAFISEQILKGRERPENFILVITSGRGRKQWQDTLQKKSTNKEDFTSFVTYRPVESLVSAVESAFSKSDDLEMKYLVFKILMGS